MQRKGKHAAGGGKGEEQEFVHSLREIDMFYAKVQLFLAESHENTYKNHPELRDLVESTTFEVYPKNKRRPMTKRRQR